VEPPGRCALPRLGSPARCRLTSVAADNRAKDGARLRRALLLIRSQLNLGVRQHLEALGIENSYTSGTSRRERDRLRRQDYLRWRRLGSRITAGYDDCLRR